MTKENKNNEPTLEEELAKRSAEIVPEPTQDEIVTQALGNLSAQKRLGTPEAETISSPPKAAIFPGATKTPVYSVNPQPAGKTSTPGLQESPQKKINNSLDQSKDPNLRRLQEFINGSGFTGDWVRLHLGHVSRIPSVIPSITLWDGPSFEDVAKSVYLTVVSMGYIENTWPILKMVMGSSRDNTEWAVGVLCTIALFDTIKIMAGDKN